MVRTILSKMYTEKVSGKMLPFWDFILKDFFGSWIVFYKKNPLIVENSGQSDYIFNHFVYWQPNIILGKHIPGIWNSGFISSDILSGLYYQSFDFKKLFFLVHSYKDPFLKTPSNPFYHNLYNKRHFPLVYYESKVHLLEIFMAQ